MPRVRSTCCRLPAARHIVSEPVAENAYLLYSRSVRSGGIGDNLTY
jgi:hypothetical protein